MMDAALASLAATVTRMQHRLNAAETRLDGLTTALAELAVAQAQGLNATAELAKTVGRQLDRLSRQGDVDWTAASAAKRAGDRAAEAAHASLLVAERFLPVVSDGQDDR